MVMVSDTFLYVGNRNLALARTAAHMKTETSGLSSRAWPRRRGGGCGWRPHLLLALIMLAKVGGDFTLRRAEDALPPAPRTRPA